MNGKLKRRRSKFQFSLRTLMVFTTIVALVLSGYLYRTKRAERHRRLKASVLVILGGSHRHEAVREHTLLRKYQIVPAGGGCSVAPSGSWGITGSRRLQMRSTEERVDWPVKKIQFAVLEGLIEAIADADLLTDAKKNVTAERAVLTGNEGQFVWEVKSVGKTRDSQATGPYRLNIEFFCQAHIDVGLRAPKIPETYKFGNDPDIALISSDVEKRRVGAKFIDLAANPNHVELLLDTIAIETDPKVIASLFRRLESVGPNNKTVDPVSTVLSEYLSFMEQDHALAPLAARTLLRSGRVVQLYYHQGVRDPEKTAVLSHLRRASMDILKNEDDRKHWPDALYELRLQKTPDDKEMAEALLDLLEKGGLPRMTRNDIRRVLWKNPHVMERLFRLLAEDDRYEIWFFAAQFLAGNQFAPFDDTLTIRDRIKSLEGIAQRRMQLAGGYEGDYKEQLAVLGDDAFEYLSQFVGYEVRHTSPPLAGRACKMLAKLGDQRAIPVLIQAIEVPDQHGELDDPWYAIDLLKAINELSGENIGELGPHPSATEEETRNANWPAIQKTLTEKFGATFPPESAIKEATSPPVQ